MKNQISRITGILCFSLVSQAFSQGSVYIDHVDGLGDNGKIVAGQPVTFYIGFDNPSGTGFGSLLAFAHGFQFSSPDGATWGALDYLPVGISAQFGVKDIGEYTPGRISYNASAWSEFWPGLAEGSSGVALRITTVFDAADAGRGLCIDAASFSDEIPWGWGWENYASALPPDWGGPYCYQIVEAGTADDCSSIINCPAGLLTVDINDGTFTYDFDDDYSGAETVQYSIHPAGFPPFGEYSIDSDGVFSYTPMDIDVGRHITLDICTIASCDNDVSCTSTWACSWTMEIVQGCCINNRGNANNDPADLTNIADITYLVNYLFGIPTGPAPDCIEEGNANADPGESINIADISFLVAYLFGIPPGAAPQSCP